MFLPTTRKELDDRGIDRLDVILVTGDTYIDSPFMGASLIGRVLESKGFTVGIIAQPDTDNDRDISRLGEPRLFWGITGGAVDSMVANYTASKKWRKRDDYTPGGENTRRPDRAVIVYTNLVRRFFKPTVPIVLGGIEASLRRIAHYDFWSNKIRRSILFDSKADYILFGMAHAGIVELARVLDKRPETMPADTQDPVTQIPGLGYIAKTPKGITLPAYEAVIKDKDLYIQSFKTFYDNTDPMHARPLSQAHADRFLVLNPPAHFSTTKEMDEIHDLNFQRNVHPYYRALGHVQAMDTIRFSIPTHYGCYGECNFCAITVHQGRTVRWRSKNSIIAEAKKMTRDKDFKGYIFDLGGPTANMYGFECEKKLKKGACTHRRCLFPTPCPSLSPDHGPQMDLLNEISRLAGVKKVFLNSGIRHDLILMDKQKGQAYLKQVTAEHVSGQMKLAPEHCAPGVLALMGKPGMDSLVAFKHQFDSICKTLNKKQYLTYYLIAAHPGCTVREMNELKAFTQNELHITPEQVQIFTPTPSTFSTLMYYTGIDPFAMVPVFVEKDPRAKERQKQIVTRKTKRRAPTPPRQNRNQDKVSRQGKKLRRRKK
ncbi:YgiQ family radical SAM protein [Desulfobacter hydrogenophilus]|uniref:YgiQ family radical SAM protein n=1 Tax=Desulfobacter hydrogenophilus TaxID=2291 RepID=A0A328FH52_9BACT|nr:YgiQ family radical SAM protein [Desulfobacter hydrogenophilus]NDY71421.1 YgiQ family radical SAM protein [Desulfobacter hydrogenophilus]QBH12161.1 YgiQ family radical SAM protein [Desulfobacter hydrogenophilus]RAM03516.1 YgiQ family radical SAM protein [Desulfobacter hydrogenophilus]